MRDVANFILTVDNQLVLVLYVLNVQHKEPRALTTGICGFIYPMPIADLQEVSLPAWIQDPIIQPSAGSPTECVDGFTTRRHGIRQLAGTPRKLQSGEITFWQRNCSIGAFERLIARLDGAGRCCYSSASAPSWPLRELIIHLCHHQPIWTIWLVEGLAMAVL